MKLPCFGFCKPEGDASKKKQFLMAFIVTLSIFSTGLHVGWPAPSLPKILSEEFPFEITSDEASNILIFGYVGDIIGGVLCCCLFDKIGRKKTMMLMFVPQVLGFISIYLSWTAKELLYVGRFFGGLAEASLFSLCAMYIAESVEPDIRGRFGGMAPLFLQFSILSINIFGSYFSVYTTSLICTVFPIIFLLLLIKMPESPYYLLMKSDTAGAEEALKYLLDKEKVDKELDVLKQDVKRQMTESGTFKDLIFIESNRKALLLTIFARFIQQFSGCQALGNYLQVIMKDSITFLTPLEGSTLLLSIQTVMVIFALSLVDKYGRKPLLISSSIGMFFANTLNGVYYTLRDYTEIDTQSFDFVPLILIIAYHIFFSAGLQPLVNLLNSEMFSQTVKAKAYIILNINFSVLAPITLKFYQFFSDYAGNAVPFYCFGVASLIGALVFMLVFPETKGKRLEEIQQELKGNKSSKKITP